MTQTVKRLVSTVAIVCFALIATAVLIAHQYPASGYELSIYDSVPLITWACLLLSILGGIGIVVHQLATQGYKNCRFWMLGLVVILLAITSVLYLPYIRGYVTWAGDNITHIGMLKDILSSGHISSYNEYPITHIFLSEIKIVTGMSDIFIANCSTALFSILFVLTTYLLATAILPKRGHWILAALIVAAVMIDSRCRVFLQPNGWSLLMLPLLFYCYFKRDTSSYRILFITLLVLYPFFHPFSSLMVIIALLLFELSRWFLPRLLRVREASGTSFSARSSLWPLLLELAIFLPWILSFQQFNKSLRVMWEHITSGIFSPGVSNIGEGLNKLDIHGFDFVILLFKMYSVSISLIAFAIVGIVLIIRQARSGKMDDKQSYRLLSFASVFLCSGLIYGLSLIGAPGSEAVAAERALSYVEMFSIPFVAYALYELCAKVRYRSIAYGGLAGIIIVASFLSIRSLFFSPYIYEPNAQVTHMDMTGMTWFFDKKDTGTGCVYIMSPPSRFADGILGHSIVISRPDINYGVVQFQDHFGYTEYNTVGEQYIGDKYVAVTRFDRVIYETVWRPVGRFNEGDFGKLERDQTVDKLYTNGELDAYLIHAFGRPT